jgi:hypothetical protein
MRPVASLTAWRCYAAPLLLIAVAICQRVLMHCYQLDPWKGGGFGMFSAASSHSLRQMTVTLIGEEGEEFRFPPAAVESRIPLGGDMDLIKCRLLTMPRPAALQSLADRLAAEEWVRVRPSSLKTPVSESSVSKSDVASPLGTDATDGASDPLPDTAKAAAIVADELASEQPVDKVYYRMKKDVEQEEDVLFASYQPRAIKVEIWQYRWDAPKNKLLLTRFREATAMCE